MKWILLVALFVLCTGCGRGRIGEENGYEPEVITPLPVPESPLPTPEIPWESVPVAFADRLTDLAFTFYQPHRGWDFTAHQTSGADSVLMWVNFERTQGGQHVYESFEIWEAVSRPGEWRQTIFAGSVSLDHPPMQLWVQPDAPADVFVNEHGITFVEYRQTIEFGLGDYVVVKWVFRQDGADYRNFAMRQRYYFAMLCAAYDRLDAYLPYARAVVDSLRFTEGTPISLALTAEAGVIGITQENFPRIGGSTSTIPLVNAVIQGMYEPSEIWEDGRAFWLPYRQVRAARTIPAYELLLGGYLDMILVPDPSAHVLALAENAGIALEIIPVALEALVFITHADNPVTGITSEQLTAIYADRSITNWSQLGGNDGRILPLIRNPHSGSQALMDNMVLRGRDMPPDLLVYKIGGMMDMLESVAQPYWSLGNIGEYLTDNCFALGYTVYYYLRNEQERFREWYERYERGAEGASGVLGLKPMSLDGVFPSHATFLSGEYPLTTNYFAVIRGDSPADSPERAIVRWLVSDAGQEAVQAAGLGSMR